MWVWVGVKLCLGFTLQALPEVLCEPVEIDVFERYANSIVAVVSSTAFGLADALPIGSLVAGCDNHRNEKLR